MITLTILAVFMSIYLNSHAQSNDVCVTKEELKLYNLLNEYRKAKGLSKIDLSESLTFVAQTHVKDLTDNKPAKGSCNMHSWSDKGNWTACCYTRDHAKAQCMWDKPRELTTYKGDGFEISYGTSGYPVSAEGALSGWKSSSGHNSVIINEGIWKDMNWTAIGVGIYGGYAVVWFGTQKDSEGVAVKCK